jgi:NAD dependent epimerase/dehydratase family enzyme
MRSAMTMSPDRGGVFDVLLRLVRLGLGGTSGSGRQYISWIHETDFIAAVRWLINQKDLAGAVNLAAPNPLPNAEFMRELRRAWGARIGLPATRWMVELGTMIMRTESELVLKSRRVVPGRLLESGFRFTFPQWPAAAADLCQRWRAAERGGPRTRDQIKGRMLQPQHSP